MNLPDEGGVVYVVATPIGNLEDLSARSRRLLEEAAVIACEDTRRTGRLCARLHIRTPRISLHAHNESRRIPALLRRLEAGEAIALVSDAGTPLVSDPGARLVASAIESGFRVVPVPGPSAILAALVASGFSSRPFTFVGFGPRRGSGRTRWLETAARAPGTLVLFEAPGRVAATLADLYDVLGPRRFVVARELTKRFEEILRGRLGENSIGTMRGEVTIVVEGGEEVESVSEPEEREALIEELLARDRPLPELAKDLARVLKIPRSEAYRELLSRRR
ncbi:MAG: 16S rRNA (cytidine(1402)-2'-O)-methyltransferase [Myxococcota bacterium]